MSQPAITIENLGKQYKIGLRERDDRSFREAIVDTLAAPLRRLRTLGEKSVGNDTIWALRDVSFEVQPGEVMGIIGRNGAGKTTLLKILSRITEPTTGEAMIRGRVGSLLEVGTGFHRELTGRENIYLNGAILGMRKAEIDRKFDEIVAFAEIEKFLDTPVKRYSSGMYVRLAFAVAAHLEPEILIVDEVLAFGDAEFQKKCLGRMQDVASGEGRTVLFVSHNMVAVQALCSRAVLLRDGQVAALGSTERIIQAYMEDWGNATQVPLAERTDREGSGDLVFISIRLRVSGTGETDVVPCGSDLSVTMEFRTRRRIIRPLFCLSIHDRYGTRITHLNTRLGGLHVQAVEGTGCVTCTIPHLPLPPGLYRLNIEAIEGGGAILDQVDNARAMNAELADFYGTGEMTWASSGKVLVEHAWRLDGPMPEKVTSPSGKGGGLS